MTNIVYPKYKTALLKGLANVSLDQNDATNGPFAVLLDTGVYVANNNHEFYSDLSGIVGTEQRIVNPTVGVVGQGVFDGDNCLFPAVSGATVEAIAIFRKNSGANTTWRLVCYLDTGITGLPLTPNTGDVAITWASAGIIQL